MLSLSELKRKIISSVSFLIWITQGFLLPLQACFACFSVALPMRLTYACMHAIIHSLRYSWWLNLGSMHYASRPLNSCSSATYLSINVSPLASGLLSTVSLTFYPRSYGRQGSAGSATRSLRGLRLPRRWPWQLRNHL